MRLAVCVEGQIAEEFVNLVLKDLLRRRGVLPHPSLIGTGGRGGGVTVKRLASEMARLYHTHDAVTSLVVCPRNDLAVARTVAERVVERRFRPEPSKRLADQASTCSRDTPLVDFYGFQKRGGRTVEALEAHLREKVGERVGEGWDASRVFPYVQMHEFEGLLFSDVDVFANQIDFPDDCADVLRAVRAQFTNPEDNNDHPETAPSTRIAGVIPKYKKVVHGPMLAEEIGLATIRAECPRFDAWVTRLQSLGDRTDRGRRDGLTGR